MIKYYNNKYGLYAIPYIHESHMVWFERSSGSDGMSERY